jgi:hypothetical protein
LIVIKAASKLTTYVRTVFRMTFSPKSKISFCGPLGGLPQTFDGNYVTPKNQTNPATSVRRRFILNALFMPT